MRVGMVCPYSLTLPGGVQEQALGLSRSLRSKGLFVRLLAPCDGAPPDVDVTPLGNSVPLAANGSVAPVAPDVAAQLRTMRALWDEQFDVVHLHEPFAPGVTLTTVLLKHGPLVGTFHAAGTSAPYRWLGSIARRLADRLEIRCAVSPDAEALAAAAIGGTYEPVFNGVDVARLSTGPASGTQGPTIFFIGRHEPRKGLEVLLEAMGALPPEVRLWVGGDGPQTAELRDRVAGDARISWLGRISDAEKLARLRGADVFCAPSLRGESFGVVLLEAMAAGTPIVASDLVAYSRVARAGRDAVLVPSGDATALAAGLRDVLFGTRAPSLIASGTARAAEYSLDRLADLYIEKYERLVRHGQPEAGGAAPGGARPAARTLSMLARRPGAPDPREVVET